MIKTMLSIQAVPDISAIRTSELMNQEHTVIPCICLTEGVLWPANAPSPELALAEEFGRFPEGWNGRPIMLNHPKVDGEAVAANSPGVLDNNSFGQMFNTELIDKKLHTEIWINNARVEELGDEFQDAVDRLKSGDEIVEVSTGLFTMQEMSEGEFDGETFGSIWRNIVPDHLAILPEGIKGACSVEDGCGAPRLNNTGGKGELITRMVPVMNSAMLRDLDAAPVVVDCSCGDGSCNKCKNNTDAQDGIFKRILSIAGGVLGFKTDAVVTNEVNLSDGDIRAALISALNVAEPDRWFFILAVFNSEVVYELGWDGELFRRSFSITSDTGAISISEDRTAVRPVTSFVEVEVSTNDSNVQNAQQETEMKREELVKALIDNEGTQYTEDDSEWLLTLEDSLLARMAPVIAEDTPVDEPAADVDTPAEPESEPVTAEAYVASAPAEIQSVLNAGLSLQKSKKAAYVKGILANKRNIFTEVALNAKDLTELESIAALSQDPVTFEILNTGNTDGSLRSNDDAAEHFTPAPDIFAKRESTTH